MATILAISSQVARGSVGLSVIVPALQGLGHSVVALPTVLLSNHPGHAHAAGGRIEPAQLSRMVDALDANGWLAEIDVVLSGYLPSAAHVALVATTIARVRTASPACRYVCDPVLGDDPKGLYIEAAAAHAIRDTLLPLADAALPNRFELAWLTQRLVNSPADAVAAARALPCRTVIATSIPTHDDMLATLEITPADALMLRVARRARVPNGTGDLLSALVAAGIRIATAVAIVDAVIAESSGSEELRLDLSRRSWREASPLDAIPL